MHIRANVTYVSRFNVQAVEYTKVQQNSLSW